MGSENWIDDSDLANCERFIRWFGGDLRYVVGQGWHWWTGEIWQPNAEHIAIECAKDMAVLMLKDVERLDGDGKKAAIKWAKQSQSISKLKAVVSLAESDNRIRLPLEHFNRDPWLFNCANGTVNLKTGKLTNHERFDYCTRMSPAKYGEALIDDSLWLTFLREITDNDKGLQGYLQRVAGYCLTGSISEKCFFFCYGGGDNGKSVFIEVLYALLGGYVLALGTDSLAKKKYGNQGIPNDIARLNGPRLATVSETSKGQEWNDALIKDLTGGDVITARFLNEEFFDFRPQVKLMIRGNNKPEVTDNSSGMWKRIQLIPFEVQIPEDRQDKYLREKIIIRELSGVLQWAVEGCITWQCGGLKPPENITKAVDSYRAEMDHIGEFIKEQLEFKPNSPSSVKASDAYETYVKWCEDSAVDPHTPNKFGRALTDRGLVRSKSHGITKYENCSLKMLPENAPHPPHSRQERCDKEAKDDDYNI